MRPKSELLVMAFWAAFVTGTVGCSSGTTGSATPPAAATPTSSSGAIAVPPSTAGTDVPGGAGTDVPGGAQNLPLTPDVRSALVGAGARAHGLPASDYTGLRQGLSYYALDPATGAHWAAAQLVAAATSQQGQLSTQDDGAYTVFRQPDGGSWTAVDVGLPDPQGDCRLTPPASVLQAWGWRPDSCHPPTF